MLSAGWVGPEPYHHAQQRLMIMLRHLDDTAYYSLFTGLVVFPPETFTNEILEARIRSADAQPGTWKVRKEAHLKLLQANYEHDASAVLHKVACPALVTCAEHAGLVSGGRSRMPFLAPNTTSFPMSAMC